MSGKEYEGFVEDVRQNGLREPISLLNGKILDGRNRYRACQEAKVEPHFKELNGQGSPMDFVLSMNLHRRHLNESQRALVGAKLKPFFKEEARQRKLSGKRGDLSANLRQGRSSESAAALANVSARSVETAVHVLKDGASELIGLVEGGKVAVDQAGHLARLSKREQKDIIAKGKSEIAFAAKRIQTQLREKRTEEKFSRFYEKARPLKELEGKYHVILADPPWPYEHSESSTRDQQSKYPLMAMDQICDMEVPGICADDAVLFLWATSPKLAEALQVIDAWGFFYRTSIVWVKHCIGMGYYVRGQHELLLIAKRGNLPLPAEKNRSSSVIMARRKAHSEKPTEVYEIIEKMYPKLPKVELFARSRRDGWTSWGNECQ